MSLAEIIAMPAAVTIFYMAFGLFAAIYSGPQARILGITMLWSCLVSNVAAYTMPLDPRIIVNVMLDALVFGAARLAWHRTGSCTHHTVIVLSILSAMGSFAYAYFRLSTGSLPGEQGAEARFSYALALNILYVAQCISIGGWGLADARINRDYYRMHRTRARLGLSKAHPEHAGARRKFG